MATFEGARLFMQGAEAPFIERGGSKAFALANAPVTGWHYLSSDTWTTHRIQVLIRDLLGRLDVTDDEWTVHRVSIHIASLLGRLDATGQLWIGRFIPLSAVYKNSDRITLAGVALDLAGQPLRSMQLQFIGQTVQEHFAGASTNADGIYVAYLDTGDTYTAYAFSIGRGFVYQLDHQETQPNTTTLVFKLLTKRGGFGEGLFLQGGA